MSLETLNFFINHFSANFKTPEVYTRAARSDAESGSDTDRDEANLAEEMVGGRPWLEGEWSMSESETSGHQVRVQPIALEVI